MPLYRYREDFFKGLTFWANTSGNPAEHCTVVYGGDIASTRLAGQVTPWNRLNALV
ncbi:MAG: hypothetical protein ACOYNO_05240 [Saprospiraceae bacterium]